MHGSSRTRDTEIGLIQALLNRLNTFRLPRALKLKERVDRGAPLSIFDLNFLKQSLSKGSEARRLAAKHPEYQAVVDKMTALYTEIVRKGVENEKGAKPPMDH